MHTGQIIQNARIKKELTLSEASKLLNISKQTLFQLEKTKDSGFCKVVQVLKVYGVEQIKLSEL